LDQALNESYERLLLLSDAARRSRAELVLNLSHSIVAGIVGSKDWWQDVQQRNLDDLKAGL
jgi:hypothetical protein